MDSEGKLTLDDVEQTYGQLPSAKEIFYDWYGGNTELFHYINGIHGPEYDQFMVWATKIGDKHFFIPYLALFGICAFLSVLYRKIFKKGAVRQHIYMWIGILSVFAASFAAYAVVVYFLKDYFGYPRPYGVIEGVTLLEYRNQSSAYQSFPSGHTTFISVVIFSLWPLLSKHFKIFGLALIALVAWSRVALGVHFPADAFWGFVLGFTIVYCARIVINAFFRKIFGIHCDGS